VNPEVSADVQKLVDAALKYSDFCRDHRKPPTFEATPGFQCGNANRWDDDDMGHARRRLERGKASIEVVGDLDLRARKRDTDAPVGWQTQVMNDASAPFTAAENCTSVIRRS
jgi:hypothetical protein